MSAQTPELQLQIETWRAKIRDNTITKEEMAQAIAILRAGRAGVTQAKAGSRAKSTAAKPAKRTAEDLLREFEEGGSQDLPGF